MLITFMKLPFDCLSTNWLYQQQDHHYCYHLGTTTKWSSKYPPIQFQIISRRRNNFLTLKQIQNKACNMRPMMISATTWGLNQIPLKNHLSCKLHVFSKKSEMEIWCKKFVNVDSTAFFVIFCFHVSISWGFFVRNRLTYARNSIKGSSILQMQGRLSFVWMPRIWRSEKSWKCSQRPWQIVNFSCRNIHESEEMTFICKCVLMHRISSISENFEINCQVENCIGADTNDGSGRFRSWIFNEPRRTEN